MPLDRSLDEVGNRRRESDPPARDEVRRELGIVDHESTIAPRLRAGKGAKKPERASKTQLIAPRSRIQSRKIGRPRKVGYVEDRRERSLRATRGPVSDATLSSSYPISRQPSTTLSGAP